MEIKTKDKKFIVLHKDIHRKMRTVCSSKQISANKFFEDFVNKEYEREIVNIKNKEVS